MNDMTPKLLLRPHEAAQALAISERKLWELTKLGEIPAIRFGRAVRYDLNALRHWITGQSVGSSDDSE